MVKKILLVLMTVFLQGCWLETFPHITKNYGKSEISSCNVKIHDEIMVKAWVTKCDKDDRNFYMEFYNIPLEPEPYCKDNKGIILEKTESINEDTTSDYIVNWVPEGFENKSRLIVQNKDDKQHEVYLCFKYSTPGSYMILIKFKYYVAVYEINVSE